MKKVLPILIIIGVIGLTSAFLIIYSYNNKSNDIKKENTEHNNTDKVDVTIEENINQEENNNTVTESQNNDSVESTKNESSNNAENKKPASNNNSQSGNKTNTSNNNTSNNNANTSTNETTKTDIPVNTTPKPKEVCNSNNSGWVSYLNSWKQSNPTSVVFDTKADAINYGKYAMNDFGYAYEYTTIPVVYEDEECKKEIWSARLSVPQKTCGDNKQIWLNATKKENLTDIYDYLRKKGYDCGTKKWYK